MAVNDLYLTWLFTAYFSDGSKIVQTQEDESVTGEGSAFTDVLARQDELEAFVLRDEHGNEVGVDLRDGHFEMNGNMFLIGQDDQHMTADTRLRLIYHRRHRHGFNIGMEEMSHEVTYFIGWQFTAGGKNYQQTIGVG